MAFGVLAYPKISHQDYEFIQDFRKQNDELYYEVVDPHFAFVFPTDTLNETDFVQEIVEKTKGFEPINFEIRCTSINKDSFIDYFHLLLIPDQGHSDIIKLHDKLYSGQLFNDLRLDIDFIPHMGIANSKDKFEVKNWVDQWNANDFIIKGRIDTLTVIEYDGQNLKDIISIDLG
ncbi:MAG: 2'-5' RNA ligase family protein [Bacteroidia bacterium]|nr:2'-5' RNA ligase family protein [Bacteroidia bacterium]